MISACMCKTMPDLCIQSVRVQHFSAFIFIVLLIFLRKATQAKINCVSLSVRTVYKYNDTVSKAAGRSSLSMQSLLNKS